MKRRDREPEFVGAYEAAELLGVRQSNLRRLAGLPEPYQQFMMGALWRKQEILELAEEIRARREAA